MTQTVKNWLTTGLATAGVPALIYLTTNAPPLDTWAGWRPVLIAAAGTFLVAWYHSYQQASGPGSAAKAAAVKVAGSALMLGALVFGLGANCQAPVVSPQTQAEIQAAEQLGACVEGVYAADSQKVPAVSPVQIVIDEGAECGADLSNLVTVFGSTPTPAQSAVLQAAHDHAAEMANARLRHGK